MIRMLTLSATLTAWIVCSSSLRADVVISESVAMKAGGRSADVQRTVSLKGPMMRIEITHGDDRGTTIYDAVSGQIVLARPSKKEADVYEATKVSSEMEKSIPAERVTAELSPTSRTQDVAGTSCDEYTFVIKVPWGRDSKLVMVFTGSAWVAKQTPALDDYLAFAKHAEQRKFYFGDFAGNTAARVLALGQTVLYQQLAALGGVPYRIEMSSKFDGTGTMINLGNKMLSSSRTTTTISVTPGPLDASLFIPPSGWTIKNR